jgi:hypothetical protein
MQGENEEQNKISENIVKHYEFIVAAHMSNSFILLMTLNGSKVPLSTTQISEYLTSRKEKFSRHLEH